MLTRTEKDLIDEIVWEKLVEYAEEEDITGKLFPIERRDEGDSIKIVSEGEWPDAVEVPEGAEIPIFQPEYGSKVKTYKKIAQRVQITHEMEKDSRYDLLRRGIRKTAQKLMHKIGIDTLREAWTNAGLTYTVSGRWGGPNADELNDIAQAAAKVRNANYVPDVIVLNPMDYAHLVPLQIFTEKDKGGDVSRYDIGQTILGMDVVVTPWISENNFLVMDREQAGVLYIREPLSRESYVDSTRMVRGFVAFTRYVPATIAPSAICYATGY